MSDLASRLMPNPRALALNFVKRQMRRRVGEICSYLGPPRIEWHITSGTPLRATMPPGVEQKLSEALQKYSWASNALSDADLRATLPPWAEELLKKHGQKGEVWAADLIAWLRRMAGGKGGAGG